MRWMKKKPGNSRAFFLLVIPEKGGHPWTLLVPDMLI
jgi:hypothetical protein